MSSRGILLGLNLTFFLIGCGIMGIGLWSKYDSNFVALWNATKASEFINGAGLENAGIILITSGLVTILVSFFGCFGAWRKDKCFLSVYIFTILTLLVLEVVAVSLVFAYKSKAREVFFNGLNKTVDAVNNNETGPRDVMDTLQGIFKCCGASGPSDYNATILETMKTCETPQSTASKKDYYQEGCYKEIIDFLDKYLPTLIGLLITFLVFEFVCFAVSIRTCSKIRKQGYENI